MTDRARLLAADPLARYGKGRRYKGSLGKGPDPERQPYVPGAEGWRAGYVGDPIYKGVKHLTGDPLLAEEAAKVGSAFVDWIPGPGELIGAEESYRDFKAGDWIPGVIGAGATMLGVAPFVGDQAAAALRSAKKPLAKSVKKSIRAYHGSPHKFDKFDSAHIGAGEGNQAFGHGLYFAETEDVAKSYRGDVDQRFMATIPGQFSPKQELAWDMAQNGSSDWGIMEALVKKYGGDIDFDEAKELADWALSKRGHMYEVNIYADPDDFLDWDRPLSEQPQKIRQQLSEGLGRNALDKTGQDIVKEFSGFDPMVNVARKQGESAEELLPLVFPDATPEQIEIAIKTARFKRPGDEIASELLRQRGIPGIKYLDGGSRAAGEGSRNYVVFDDKLIEIVRTYGIAGAIAAGLLTQQQADEMQAAGVI